MIYGNGNYVYAIDGTPVASKPVDSIVFGSDNSGIEMGLTAWDSADNMLYSSTVQSGVRGAGEIPPNSRIEAIVSSTAYTQFTSADGSTILPGLTGISSSEISTASNGSYVSITGYMDSKFTSVVPTAISPKTFSVAVENTRTVLLTKIYSSIPNGTLYLSLGFEYHEIEGAFRTDLFTAQRAFSGGTIPTAFEPVSAKNLSISMPFRFSSRVTSRSSVYTATAMLHIGGGYSPLVSTTEIMYKCDSATGLTHGLATFTIPDTTVLTSRTIGDYGLSVYGYLDGFTEGGGTVSVTGTAYGWTATGIAP